MNDDFDLFFGMMIGSAVTALLCLRVWIPEAYEKSDWAEIIIFPVLAGAVITSVIMMALGLLEMTLTGVQWALRAISGVFT